MNLRDLRLLRVRKVRHVQEQIALGAWSNAQAQALRAAHQTQQANSELQRALHGLGVAQAAPRNVPQEIMLLQRCLDHLSQHHCKLAHAEAVAQAQAEQALGRWRESKRALASLERLEARSQLKLRAERECREIRAMDAIASERSTAGRRSLEAEPGTFSSHGASPDAGVHLRMEVPPSRNLAQ